MAAVFTPSQAQASSQFDALSVSELEKCLLVLMALGGPGLNPSTPADLTTLKSNAKLTARLSKKQQLKALVWFCYNSTAYGNLTVTQVLARMHSLGNMSPNMVRSAIIQSFAGSTV